MKKKQTWKRLEIHGEAVWITGLQWEVLSTLGPRWIEIRVGAWNTKGLQAMERRGWLELKWFGESILVRLTPQGVGIRDMVHIRDAEKLHNRKWKWRRDTR